MVEIHGKGNDRESKYIFHEDCYHQGGNNFACWKHQEEKNQFSQTVNNNSSQSHEVQPQKNNYLPWIIGGGIVALAFIGILVYFFTRKKEK